jgi:hypothetical protein
VAGKLLSAWNAFAGGLKWAYDTLLKPVLDALGWAYEHILKPIGDFFGGVGKALGGVGSAISGGLSSVGKALGLAEGGVVTKPTLAVIGEAGPEAVVPLREFTAVSNVRSQHVVIYPTIHIGNVSRDVDPAVVAGLVSEGLTDALRRGDFHVVG